MATTIKLSNLKKVSAITLEGETSPMTLAQNGTVIWSGIPRYIVMNTKNQHTPAEEETYLTEISTPPPKVSLKYNICVAVSQTSLYNNTWPSNILKGAQDVLDTDTGFYTGQATADMLAAMDVKYVLVGQIDLREYLHQTDSMIVNKIKMAIAQNIVPIVFVGETLEYRQGSTEVWKSRLKEIITNSTKSVGEGDLRKCMFAYEPVWAIGTGKICGPAEGAEAVGFMRECLNSIYAGLGSKAVILYAGSVSPANVAQFVPHIGINGFVVFGQGITSEKFNALMNALEAAV